MAKLEYRGPQKRARVDQLALRWGWTDGLTWVALGWALAMMVLRATQSEFLRDTFDVTPGSEAAPRPIGPGTSLGLDLLCCVPALLVLVRRAKDENFALRSPRSFVPMALLCAWMLASVGWATDRFAALVNACHWASAMAVLWAAAQLVRRWVHLRLVAAVVFSVVAVYVVKAVDFRVIEGPATLADWHKNRDKYLAQRGLEPGSFAAGQFEKKLELMEVFGFFNSPNTFGGAVSLLCVLGLGLLAQRIAERTEARWAVPGVAIPLIAGLVALAMTRSKGAFTTFVLALAGMAALWRWRGAPARLARGAFIAGVVVIVGGVIAVTAYGMARGRLPSSTLTFRWQYWVGAARMIKDRPVLGTGWASFGESYLAHRLPNAPEEIKDPHNFLVRFASELGIVGLALVIAWVGRLWWELTRPTAPPEGKDKEMAPAVVKFVSAVAAGAALGFLLFGVDWAREPIDFLLIRLLFFGVTILVAALAGLTTVTSQEADERPAPWVLYGVLLAVVGMMLHNLVDFSMFEIGPMFLMAMLIGSGLGIRQAGEGPRRAGGGWLLAGGAIAWLAAAFLVWMPIATAERKASDADDKIRDDQPASAEELLVQANRDAWELNADYAYRAARVAPQDRARGLMAEAISENPKEGLYRVTAARLDAKANPPDRPGAKRHFEEALTLDPNNVRLRLDFADTLAGWGEKAEAARQYREALRYNDLLNPDEKKRLTIQEVKEVESKIAAQG